MWKALNGVSNNKNDKTMLTREQKIWNMGELKKKTLNMKMTMIPIVLKESVREFR